MIDSEQIKKTFPIFERENGLVFLDNASTTQKPARVLDAERNFYLTSNANIHRGVYGLAERADAIYEDSRKIVADFVGAGLGFGGDTGAQIVFTKNATEAANLLAFGIGESSVNPGDNIVVTELEHHANFLPWQEMARRKQAEFRVIPITDDGLPDMAVAAKMIDSKTRVVAVTQMSNVLGVRPDIQQIVAMAEKTDALVVMDAAQSVAHGVVNFPKLKVDAAFLTGHKIYAPMGTGVLYLTNTLAAKLPPFLTGGGMIGELPDNWLDSPQKFEAGTPNVAGIAGLAEAIKFMQEIGPEEIAAHEKQLAKICREVLSGIPEVKLFGPEDPMSLTSIVSFDVEGVHPHDLASILAGDNICIRAGHHCAKPLLNKLGKKALARVSFGIYNQSEDIEKLKTGILKAIKTFK